jgi:hypothetical protein
LVGRFATVAEGDVGVAGDGERAGLLEPGLHDAGGAGEGVHRAPRAVGADEDRQPDADDGQHGQKLEEGEGLIAATK